MHRAGQDWRMPDGSERSQRSQGPYTIHPGLGAYSELAPLSGHRGSCHCLQHACFLNFSTTFSSHAPSWHVFKHVCMFMVWGHTCEGQRQPQWSSQPPGKSPPPLRWALMVLEPQGLPSFCLLSCGIARAHHQPSAFLWVLRIKLSVSLQSKHLALTHWAQAYFLTFLVLRNSYSFTFTFVVKGIL